MQNKSVCLDLLPNIEDVLEEKKFIIDNLIKIDDTISKVQANCIHTYCSRIKNTKQRTVEVVCTKCKHILTSGG